MADESIALKRARPRRRWHRLAAWVAALCLLMLFLAVSCSPSTPVSALPDARQANEARLAFDQVRAAAGAGRPVNLSFDWNRFEGSAIVAARTFGIKRVSVRQFDDQLRVSASIPLPAGLWLNVTARPRPSVDGFPAVPMKIGWLPVPAFATRIGLETLRFGLWLRGKPVPSLDTMVRRVDIRDDGLAALVQIPKGRGLQRALATLQSDPVDSAAVARHYCRLVEAQRESPAPDLASQTRRAFAGVSTAENGRAAFVALGMLAVSPKVGDVAGDAALRVRSCPAPYMRFTLLDRGDLAKHWALSAALAAALGGDVSDRLGVWKEISDSAKMGTGFSFVDLSANRSGIAYALKASDPVSARKTAAKLAAATDEVILPVRMLALAEGLTEEEFKKRYVSVESPEYRATQARIDRTLATVLND